MPGWIDKVLNNKYRNDYTIQLITHLIMVKLAAPPFVAKLISPFLSGLLGIGLENGILKIDLTLDALKEGMKLKEFKAFADSAYEKTISRVHSEEEKESIRNQYLAAVSKFSRL